MPILTVTGGATIREGEKAIFTVSLTSALTQDVWFRASTITSAGASSADGDYDAILDKLFFIPAGSKKINISVQTHNAGTQNEGLEGVGLWVDEVYHYDVTIGGTGKGYVTILDTIPPIELSVRNTSGNEGNKIGFIVEAENPVLYDTNVYLQVQGTTTAGIASGNWWVAGVIKSGKTSTTVNISTIDDGQSGNRRIDVKLFSYYEEVVMLDDTAYVTVYNTTPNQLPILDIFAGGDVNEGQETISYARLSFTVNYDVTFQVSTWLGEASGDANRNPDSPDYEYLLNKTFTIFAGTTTTPIPVQTLPNKDPTDWAQEVFSIRVEPSSVSGATLGQARADILIKDVVGTTPISSSLPILTLYPGSDTLENDETTSYAKLDKPTDHAVTFTVATYTTYDQANVLGEGGDYIPIDKSFTIPAGETIVPIPVKTNQNLDPADWAEELFELRIDPVSVQGATLGTGVAMLNVIDVAAWDVVPTAAVTAADISDHVGLITDLNDQVGTNTSASIISDSQTLSSLGKTMDVLGLLPQAIKDAVTWFVGSKAYASVEELPPISESLNDIAKGLRLENYVPPANQSHIVDGQVSWTSTEVEENNWAGVRPGDAIDGRVAVTQPFATLSVDGNDWEVSQGMSDGTTGMASHNTEGVGGSFGITEVAVDYKLDNGHLQVSGVEQYFYAQAPGTIVSYADNTTGDGPGQFGNSITIKLDQKASLLGKTHDVYVTYAHAKAGSIASAVGVDWHGKHVEAGTPLGVVGKTGFVIGGEHIHTMYAVGTYIKDGHEMADSRINPDNPESVNNVALPPVYIMGFTADQNGFPQGPSAGVKPLWVGVSPDDDGFDIPNMSTVSGVESADPVGENIHIGTDGVDNHFEGTPGDDFYDGKGGYNQVNYFGPTSHIENFTTTQNQDGTIKVVSVEFGTDTFKNIQGIWLNDEFRWYTVEDLLAPVNTLFTTSENPVLVGTPTIDILIGDDNQNWFIGSQGNDTYNGHNGYDQVEYYGPDAVIGNFNFTKGLNGSVSVHSPYGSETYNSIEGIWLDPQLVDVVGQWYSIETLTLL